MPAHNFIYKGSAISSDYAKEIMNSQGGDLSKLSPEENSLWSSQLNQSSDYDNKLLSQSGENVDFKNIVTTNDGLMRFDPLRAELVKKVADEAGTTPEVIQNELIPDLFGIEL